MLTRVTLLKNIVEACENGYTENTVKDAISFLRKKDYFVKKIPKIYAKLQKNAVKQDVENA